jgi:hypothetical protein
MFIKVRVKPVEITVCTFIVVELALDVANENDFIFGVVIVFETKAFPFIFRVFEVVDELVSRVAVLSVAVFSVVA